MTFRKRKKSLLSKVNTHRRACFRLFGCGDYEYQEQAIKNAFARMGLLDPAQCSKWTEHPSCHTANAIGRCTTWVAAIAIAGVTLFHVGTVSTRTGASPILVLHCISQVPTDDCKEVKRLNNEYLEQQKQTQGESN